MYVYTHIYNELILKEAYQIKGKTKKERKVMPVGGEENGSKQRRLNILPCLDINNKQNATSLCLISKKDGY